MRSQLRHKDLNDADENEEVYLERVKQRNKETVRQTEKTVLGLLSWFRIKLKSKCFKVFNTNMSLVKSYFPHSHLSLK